MAVAGFCSETFVSNWMQAPFKSGICCNQPLLSQNLKIRGRLLDFSMFSLSRNISKWAFKLPYKYHMFKCRASPNADPHLDTSFVKNSAINYTWSFKSWQGSPFMVEMTSSVVVGLTIWGFLHAVHLIRKIFTNMDFQGGGTTILLLLLLGLRCRGIFPDFFASVMFHATRSFDVDELIQIMDGGNEIIGNVEKIGFWSTRLESITGGSVIIPNYKFANTVIRNLSQQNHREINIRATTTLDASKVNKILADMRQVLKKNPRVEQQKFHPRVLVKYNDSQDHDCSILVSCFIIPSDLKDYLCVRSDITLELFEIMCDVKRSGS